MIVTLTEINHLKLLYPQKHLMRKRICLFILLVSQVFISSVYGTNPVTQLIKDFNITNQSPNIDLNSYLGAYYHPNLIYISFQGKKLQPKFPEHSPSEEFKTLFHLVSAGIGYQKFTSPTQSFGGYLFLDIAPSLGYRHLNIGLQKSENVWQFHVNGYLPLSNTYYPEFGIPQPEIEERVKNEQGNVCLQKSYYLEKGNFGVDFIISHLHTLFKGLTFSVGPYYFYNGYDQSHVIGGAEEFEYTINPYCSLYQKLTYDSVNTMVLKAGLTLNLLGSSSQSETSFFVQPQWITNKRHLSPRYLLTTTLQEVEKDVKTEREKEKYDSYQGEEENEDIDYDTEASDSPSAGEDDNASYRSEKEKKPYRAHKKKREKRKGKSKKVSFSFSNIPKLFKSSREKKSNKNEKKSSQRRKEQEKTHQFKSRSKTKNKDRRKERHTQQQDSKKQKEPPKTHYSKKEEQKRREQEKQQWREEQRKKRRQEALERELKLAYAFFSQQIKVVATATSQEEKEIEKKTIFSQYAEHIINFKRHRKSSSEIKDFFSSQYSENIPEKEIKRMNSEVLEERFNQYLENSIKEDIKHMTPGELKKMYRVLALHLHPDRNGSTVEATKEFQNLQIHATTLGIISE